MTGYAQPPDPDDDPVGAESAAAQPMQPDDPAHPDEQDIDDAVAARNATQDEPAGDDRDA